MSVGLLIVTHGQIGDALLHTATELIDGCPLQAVILAVNMDSDIETLKTDAIAAATSLDQGQGVLILTDMYGATPSNVARLLIDQPHTRVVAGLNLPMLIRILNYPHLSLDELAHKALSGGRDGVLACETKSGS